MRVYVNGEETDIAEGLTVAGLVADKGLKPGAIVIERNLVILAREEWPQTELAADDKLEIVTFMGGG